MKANLYINYYIDKNPTRMRELNGMCAVEYLQS